MNPCVHPRCGDVYLATFTGYGSVQTGYRPVLVFQNNEGNSHSQTIIVLPFTSSLKKKDMPTHVVIRKDDVSFLTKDSMILCENPTHLDKRALGNYIGHLSDRDMRRVAVGFLNATGALDYLDFDSLKAVYLTSKRLNNNRTDNK